MYVCQHRYISGMLSVASHIEPFEGTFDMHNREGEKRRACEEIGAREQKRYEFWVYSIMRNWHVHAGFREE